MRDCAPLDASRRQNHDDGSSGGGGGGSGSGSGGGHECALVGGGTRIMETAGIMETNVKRSKSRLDAE